MIDGDYTDDGCCMEWENSKVTPTVMLDYCTSILNNIAGNDEAWKIL